MNNFDNNVICAYGITTGQGDQITPILPGGPTEGPKGPTGPSPQIAPTGPTGSGSTGPQPSSAIGKTGPRGIGLPGNGSFSLEVFGHVKPTNTTEQLFTSQSSEINFVNYANYFGFVNGTLYANFIGRPKFFVFGVNIYATAYTYGIIEDSFMYIKINDEDTFAFGAQKYPNSTGPEQVMYNCCEVFYLSRGDYVKFYLSTKCSAPHVLILARISGFALS